MAKCASGRWYLRRIFRFVQRLLCRGNVFLRDQVIDAFFHGQPTTQDILFNQLYIYTYNSRY